MTNLPNDFCAAAFGSVRAAIDLGTVTSRLLVARIDAAGIKPLARKTIITHMGEGLAQSGRIGEAAIKRVCNAISVFKAIIADVCANLGLDKTGENPVHIPVRAIATSAMRDAANSDEIITLLAESGLFVEVIAGRREAELSFRGTLTGFPLGYPLRSLASSPRNETREEKFLPPEQKRSVMTIDVGGGSTEVIFGEQSYTADGSQKVLIEKAISFNMGSRRITDRFLHSDPPAACELAAARDWISEELATFFSALKKTPDVVIAVAGVATTTVSVLERMENYDPEKVHGTVVTLQELEALLESYVALPLSSRCAIVGLEPGRAPVIIGGTLALASVLRAAGVDAFIVSESDILQGILLLRD